MLEQTPGRFNVLAQAAGPDVERMENPAWNSRIVQKWKALIIISLGFKVRKKMPGNSPSGTCDSRRTCQSA
jgi:hypothetical protein